MKRQISQLRHVLLEIEEDRSVGPEGAGDDWDPSPHYHALLLRSGGYLAPDPRRGGHGRWVLTWSGCNLLDILRNEERMRDAQELAEQICGDRDNLEFVLAYVGRPTPTTPS